MKFLEHLKQFNKLVIEENARLKGISDQLISEAKEENIKVDETEEEVKENDLLKNKPHNAHKGIAYLPFSSSVLFVQWSMPEERL